MKQFTKKGRVVLTISTVKGTALGYEDIIVFDKELRYASDVPLLPDEKAKLVKVIICDNKRPLVGDRLYYNGRPNLYHVLEINDKKAKIVEIPAYVKTGEPVEVANLKNEAFEVSLIKLYHRALVVHDQMSDKFLQAIVMGKIREGYIVKVVMNSLEKDNPKKKTPVYDRQDETYLKDGKAVIRPFSIDKKEEDGLD